MMNISSIIALLLFVMTPAAMAQTTDNMDHNQLTTRQLHLATCAALEAQGDMERLDGALRKALDEGMAVNELKEGIKSYNQIHIISVESLLKTAVHLSVCPLHRQISNG